MTAVIVFFHKGAYNTLYRVRSMIVNHMVRVPLGNLSEKHTGEIKKVISEDIEKLELFLAYHLLELVMYAAGPLAIFQCELAAGAAHPAACSGCNIGCLPAFITALGQGYDTSVGENGNRLSGG